MAYVPVLFLVAVPIQGSFAPIYKKYKNLVLSYAGHLPLANILCFFGKKKHQVFSPAAANKTLHTLKLFLIKLGK
jgi:hypothetical protein